MFLYPYMNLFITSLFTSTFMAISSNHWLMIWMALEINMISFIPLISSFSWGQEAEGALKYLLFQALGSSFILASILNSLLLYFPFMGLCIKLGLAPVHYWFPSVMKSVNWFNAALLMTWQKIAPMMILMSLYSSHKILLTGTGIISALVGGVGGFNQNHFRALLAYSSIGHMGWIISSFHFAPTISMFYLSSYILISLAVITAASLSNISSLLQTSKPYFLPIFLLVIPCILSLSGLPPFMGFFPKMFVIYSLHSLVLPLFLLLGSVLNLSYYLNFFFIAFLSSTKTFISLSNLHMPVGPAMMTFIASSPVPFIFIFFYFYYALIFLN